MAIGLHKVPHFTAHLKKWFVMLLQDAELTAIGFEHPESDVHPGMASLIVDYAKQAAETKQVIFTTHSPDVIEGISAGSIRVVEKIDGVTRVGPLDASQRQVVEDGLFGLNELVRIEGLKMAAGL